MKNLILAAALTGSCALLYILYRMKLNAQEKRAHKKDKMKDSATILCDKVGKKEIISCIKAKDDSGAAHSLNAKLYSDILNMVETKDIEGVEDKNVVITKQNEDEIYIQSKKLEALTSQQPKTEMVEVSDQKFIKLNTNGSDIELDVQSICSTKIGKSITQDCNENVYHATIHKEVPDKELGQVSVELKSAALLDYLITRNSCKKSSSEVLELESSKLHENDTTEKSPSKICKVEQESSGDEAYKSDTTEKSVSKILELEHKNAPTIDEPHENDKTEITFSKISELKHQESCDNEPHENDACKESLIEVPKLEHQESSEPFQNVLRPVSESCSNKLESKECDSKKEDAEVTKSSLVADEDKIVTKLEDKASLEVTAKSGKKSKRQKKKEKRALHSKELESCETKEESKTPDCDESNKGCEKMSDSGEKSLEKSNLKEGVCPLVKNLDSKLCASSPDQLCTSDLERETSETPEQENVASDSQSLISQASLDSGQGSIEVDQETIFSNIGGLPENNSEQYITYQFEVPQLLVGKLIGRRGAFLNKLKSATSTNILLDNHSNKEFKLCSIEGKKWQVLQAVAMIREHFPVDQFPDLSVAQINNTPLPSPQHLPQMNRQILQVELPPGVVLEVQASAVISTGEVWLQQPLHPTYLALQRLHQCLNLNYEDGSSTPVLPLPIPPNTICVCLVGDQWMRAQVLDHDATACTVSLLDVGGHVSVPLNLLRQIRVDYISLPFQATQCYLYGIEPVTEGGWEEEGSKALQELVKNNIIYSAIAAYSQDGVPLVNLYQRQYNQYVFINDSIVKQGHAKWIASA